ncbi:MAG: hypothetical protein SFY56_05585 [Bacteroidota bacterium]|nr:hypothetical protein [Bacteroidota bacterium]
MKVLIHIVLFSLVFSLYAKLHVCINYIINQKYYAEVLCEKKSEPESCCKGKCAMEKELINVSEKENTSANSAAKNNTPVLKIGKTEEALCLSLRLNNYKNLISIINSPYTKKECVGEVFRSKKPPAFS